VRLEALDVGAGVRVGDPIAVVVPVEKWSQRNIEEKSQSASERMRVEAKESTYRCPRLGT